MLPITNKNNGNLKFNIVSARGMRTNSMYSENPHNQMKVYSKYYLQVSATFVIMVGINIIVL